MEEFWPVFAGSCEIDLADWENERESHRSFGMSIEGSRLVSIVEWRCLSETVNLIHDYSRQ